MDDIERKRTLLEKLKQGIKVEPVDKSTFGERLDNAKQIIQEPSQVSNEQFEDPYSSELALGNEGAAKLLRAGSSLFPDNAVQIGEMKFDPTGVVGGIGKFDPKQLAIAKDAMMGMRGANDLNKRAKLIEQLKKAGYQIEEANAPARQHFKDLGYKVSEDSGLGSIIQKPLLEDVPLKDRKFGKVIRKP